MQGMEQIPQDESLVHERRVTQLKRLGIPGPLAEAGDVDWHQIARLVQRGCSPKVRLARRALTAPAGAKLGGRRQARDRHHRPFGLLRTSIRPNGPWCPVPEPVIA
jgi:hypothetical protein